MKLGPPPSRLFHTPMVSRCHSRVWCVGLGLAHPQVVANQNHPRSFSKAPQGPHDGWGSALALGSEDMVILPPQQHQEGHADKAHCQKKKKKIISFWASCEHIQSPKKYKTFLLFPYQDMSQSNSPFYLFFYSFAFLSCPGSALTLPTRGQGINTGQTTPGSTQEGKCRSFCSSD